MPKILNKSSNDSVRNFFATVPVGKLKPSNIDEDSSFAKIIVDIRRIEDKIPDIKSVLFSIFPCFCDKIWVANAGLMLLKIYLRVKDFYVFDSFFNCEVLRERLLPWKLSGRGVVKEQ